MLILRGVDNDEKKDKESNVQCKDDDEGEQSLMSVDSSGIAIFTTER